MVNGNLPDGWELSTLGEIADLIGGGTPSREHPEYFSGNHVWLTPTEIPRNRVTVVSTSREKITDDGLKKSSARLLPKGTVLMTSRASIGYVAIAGTEVTTNQGFASFICKDGIYNHYLAYWLLGNADFFIEQATGTTFKEITKSKLRNFSLPLPPLPEQERIVAKIEELFTQLDAGTAALKRVQAGLKRYKASVLQAACEGKLVKQDANELSVKESLSRLGIKPIAEEELPTLPSGWCWATINQLASPAIGSIQSGPFGSDLLHSEFQDIGILAIGIDNVLDGKFSLGRQHRISPEKYSQLKKFAARPLDVLITVMATVGRCCVIPADLETAIITKHVYRISVEKTFVDPYYLMYSLMGDKIVREQLFGEVRGQTRPGINGTILKKIAIPLPPLAEQRRIVAEVERRVSVVNEVESAVSASLARASRLRQSVLKSAFEGRLG